MKNKKVAALLLTMALCAGMAVPQTIVPFGVQTALAEETSEVQSDQNVVKVTNEEELVTALKNASTDETNPTIIELQNDITFTEDQLSATTNIKIPANTFVTIRSSNEAQYVISHNVKSTVVTDENCILYSQAKRLVLENVIIDGAESRRCLTHNNASSEVILNNKAVIKNGRIDSSGLLDSVGGLGICVESASTILTINEGAEITGCSFKDNNGVILGKAIYTGTTSTTLNINGGRIYENNDVSTVKYNNRYYASYGAVYCKGPFNMRGGKIDHNSGYYLGGVYAGYNTELSGGEISYNSADARVDGESIVVSPAQDYQAGGLMLYGSTAKRTFVINDGMKISNNTVIDSAKTNHSGCGGGITLRGKGTLTMNGGEISNNTAQSTLETVDLENGAANGGGLYIRGGKFILNGGSITGNKAISASSNQLSGNGGGIYIAVSLAGTDTAPSLEISGGTINNNIANDNRGNGIYVANHMNNISVNNQTQALSASNVVATPVISLKGNVEINDGIYLPAKCESGSTTGKAELTVAGDLRGSSVKVNTEKSDVGTVIANAADGYEGLYDDASAFEYFGADSENREVGYQDGKLVLVEKAASSIDFSKAEISDVDNVIYNGVEQKPEPEVKLDGKTLKAGEDFDYTYKNNKDAGTATITVVGRSPYKGSKETTFVIENLDISDASIIKEDLPSRTYTGEAFEPDVEFSLNGTKLKRGTDYELGYEDNTDPGEATVIVNGTGNFKGSYTMTFQINSADGSTMISDGKELKEKIEALTDTSTENPAKYTLAKDITVDGSIQLPEGQYVEINGNHKTMSSGQDNYATADESGVIVPKGMFVVDNGASLTLTDKMTIDGKYQERLVYVCEGGTFEAEKGVTLTGGRATDQADDIAAYGGQCIYNLGTTAFDGTISDNKTLQNTYGVIYNNGELTFAGDAKISNISVESRGAVFNDTAGTFTMNGGSISAISYVQGTQRTPLSREAKALYNLGTAVMKGGSISDNKGMYPAVYNGGSFAMEGGSISNNENMILSGGSTTFGCGTVLLQKEIQSDTEPVFTMTGGEIFGNTVNDYGGGVAVLDGTFTMNGENAVIKDNTVTLETNTGLHKTSETCGGGIYVGGGDVELKAGSVTGNAAYMTFDSGARKQAYNNTAWYYVSNGDPTQVSGNAIGGGGNDKYYGLGGGIFVLAGTLKVSGGVVSDNLSVPTEKDSSISAMPSAAGIYVYSGYMEMSGTPQIKDPIYLSEGKNITITDKLTGTEPYTVYQTQNDLQMKENCSANVGKAVATYAQGSDAYQKSDGDHFKLYAYDETYDYAVDKTLTHYTAFEDGIYVNRPVMDVADLAYEFTNADGREEDGTYFYRYNSGARNARNTSVTASADYKDAEGNVLATVPGITNGNGIDLTIQGNNGDAGTYTVTVAPDPNDQEGYHYTGSYELKFKINPLDLSEPIWKTDDDGNVIYYDADGNVTDADHGTPEEDASWLRSYKFEAVHYEADDPTDKAYTPQTTVGVRLNSNRETILEEGKDFVVTATNNTSGSSGNIIATIEGIGNYTGKLVENVDTGISVKALQTITAADIEKHAGEKAFALGASSSDPKATFSYVSSDENVVTVDENGQVSLVGEGTAEITVTASETDTSRPAQKVVKVTALEKVKTGWLQEDGYWYYYDNNGTMVKNTWKQDSKGWCYLGTDGKMVTNGWAKDSKGWCWMGSDGYWVKNKWIQYNGAWYFIKSNGYMAAGEWAQDSKGWCYLGTDGKMVTNGWAKDSKGWCWMGSDGYWVKNKWIQYKGEWYYIKSNGYMAANEWAKDSGGWMYMDASGKITKDKWIQSGGYWYYLKSNGYMATGTMTISGKTYQFDSSGKWIS